MCALKGLFSRRHYGNPNVTIGDINPMILEGL